MSAAGARWSASAGPAPADVARTDVPKSRRAIAGTGGIALAWAALVTGGLCAAPHAAAQDAPLPIAAWSRSQAVAEDRGTPAERGRAVFNNWCSACHSHGPLNAPGTTSLQNKYRGEIPAALEDRTDLTPELVVFYVRNGVATMPFFRPTELSDADVAALGAYLAKD